MVAEELKMKFIAAYVVVLSCCLICAYGATTPEDVSRLFSNQSLNEIVSIAEKENSATIEDLMKDDLRQWIPPDYIKKHFPYYLSGFDFEDRPIWVAEVGKFNMRELVARGPESVADFEKYAVQTAQIISDSAMLKHRDNDKVTFIADMEGFRYEYFADVPTLAFMLRLVRYYRDLLEEGSAYAAIVNANYVTQTLVNILKPVLGRALENIDVFGTNKSYWIPRLLRHFPQESLAEWYGGYKNFTPIKVCP